MFKPGDLVYLPPHGGIPMTVEAVVGDQVECVWLDTKRHAQRQTFSASLLKPFQRPRPIRVSF